MVKVQPWVLVLKIALIVAAGLWIYAPALNGAWLMDDDLYFPHNPLRFDPERLWKIWFAPGQFIEYYPISETLQMLQWNLWGNRTFGYHLTNVLLHIANGLLLWRLLERFGLKLAWLGGLLFVVHPANVESVAWIAELKNALSLPFFLLAATAWVDFEDRKQPRDYWLALGFFLVAMLCKIAMAPFPVVILLYAWWKRGRITARDCLAAVPFLVISVALAMTTLLAGKWFLALHHTTDAKVLTGGLAWRFDLAGITSSSYLSRVFWPFPLDPMDPPWRIDPTDLRQWVPWLPLLAGAAWFWNRRATWGRHALLGLGFFFLMLAPFLGFEPVSYMRNSWVFDHFLYLPMVGIIALIIAAVDDLRRKMNFSARWIATVAVALAWVGFAIAGHAYAAKFVRPSVYFAYIVQLHPDSWASHNGYGNELRGEGLRNDAIVEFETAERLDPTQTAPLNNLGAILFEMHRYADAVEPYQKAIALDPNDPQTQTGLGNAYLRGGDMPKAVTQFEQALKIKPDDARAQNGLANALLSSGQLPEALAHAEEAIKIAPDYMEAHATLGLIDEQQGRIPDAITEFEQAQKIAPDDPRVKQILEALQATKTQK